MPWSSSRTKAFARDATLESLAKLKPIMKDGVVTAGNASQQNDAAAACLVVAEDKLAELGLEPMGCPGRLGRGRLRSVAHGHRPGAGGGASCSQRTGLALRPDRPGRAQRSLRRQVLAVLKGWGCSMNELEDRLNVNGSGISLGHPIGATGGRIMATLLHEMQRRKARYGLETMCIGGGQGIAAIFERA